MLPLVVAAAGFFPDCLACCFCCCRFVNMVDQSGFKDDHLCFAKAANESMAVFDKILELPVKNKTKPNDMNGKSNGCRV
jgi:hypothetical protein